MSIGEALGKSGRKMDAAWKKAISDGKKGINTASKKLNKMSIGKTALLGGLAPGLALASGYGAAGVAQGLAKRNLKSAGSALAYMPSNAIKGTAMFGLPGAALGVAAKLSADRNKRSKSVKGRATALLKRMK